ncbi:MAG: hypothetical protein ACXW20_22245, partial [Burkholderiales bacterium]
AYRLASWGELLPARSAQTLGLMRKSARANLELTWAGGIAVVLMVAAWIIGIAVGTTDPSSWVAQLISLPFGRSIYIAAVTALFTALGAVSGKLGWPFFTHVRGAKDA